MLAYCFLVALLAWCSFIVTRAYVHKTPYWIGVAIFNLLLSEYMILRVAIHT